MTLKSRYLARLEIDESSFEGDPTYDNLAKLTEAHVSKIPYDNLAQHGAVGGPVVLDEETIANKLLERKRGGFCLELNGLFAELLIELGYGVVRVPSFVFAPDVSGFRDTATHIFLIVTVPEDQSRRMVDVGFGESPIHPLRYEMDTVQITPEGMESRIMLCGDDEVVLEWKKESEWAPRFKWQESDVLWKEGPMLGEFQYSLECVHRPESIFSQKLVVCLTTREKKISLSGRKFKVTAPRFGPDSKIAVKAISSEEEARKILTDEFNIPYEETEGLDLRKSTMAPVEIWESM